MICVDASVAVKWILDEEHSDRATALYEAVIQSNEPIVASTLLPLEVTNILRQRMRAADGLSLDRATLHLDDFFALPIEIHSPDGLHQRALILADALGLPTTYDAHYLALAERFGCDLWTADARLVRQVKHALPFVRGIDDYDPDASGIGETP